MDRSVQFYLDRSVQFWTDRYMYRSHTRTELSRYEGNMLLSECDRSTPIQSNKIYATHFCYYYFTILPNKITPASYIYPIDIVS